MKGQQRQTGVVLLSVLLILALLTALVYQLVGRQSLLIAQARQTFAGDQALGYALGGESFARQVLYQDWQDTGAVDDLTELWATPQQPFEVENGFLEIQIRDLNSCFNLNNLASTGGRTGTGRLSLQRFKTLLRNTGLPESLADVWLDWIDPDQDVSGFGAEDGEYLLKDFAHRTADQLAGHPSEIRLIRDMDAQTLQTLSPHLCTLPTDTLKLNINTASAMVLASLAPSLSESQMQALTLEERTYTAVNQVTAEYPDLATAVDALSVSSEYFEVQVRAQVDDALIEVSSVLYRASNDGAITLLTRDFGKTFRSLFSSRMGAANAEASQP